MTTRAIATHRVVAHLDLDAFYCQVERRDLRAKTAAGRRDGRASAEDVPLVVVQYNPFERGGVRALAPDDDRELRDGFENHSLIAVSYEARARGVKRNMRGREARALAPACAVVQVPTRRSKADLTLYREAGREVAAVLARGGTIERASIDEAYLDLTESAKKVLEETAWATILEKARTSHAAGASAVSGKGYASVAWWNRDESEWREEEKLLAAGAYICFNLRKACVDELGYTLSAGIALNKMLAKLTSGMNKPASQTVLCPDHTSTLLDELPIDRIRGLGAKFGRELADGLNVKTIGELARTPLRKLEEVCGEEKAQWVRKVSLGLDDDPVKAREMPKSIGTGKTFRGALAIRSIASAKHWLAELTAELNDRCEADEEEWNRVPKLLTLGLSSPDERETSSGHCSRRCPLRPGADEMAQDALTLLSKWASGRERWSITGMSVSASNFVSLEKDSGDVVEMFKNATKAAKAPASVSATPAASPIKADQIDKNVLAELPEAIQREIRASMGLLDKSTGGGVKRKNEITNYFSKKR
ncbi:predicted protein [Ostreococcus lucimarinus CCE9901]|uniref:DNA polymerase eta n=1 Tax=Ostreococcus lucimarinus (strain CCE9901) TaxID=436017 RepID=A4S4R4_OSTLU|nr:predicted protein [Ostreococcus lucimarinus CCE9901]ABO98773.1 predicted protein [Ostreococcus lucimarinus CCE9901]|eukprot:XP_001420480.1 predicted protein [Ostreococcus lucimarinus CCE9901]